jgi:hypothetical protein
MEQRIRVNAPQVIHEAIDGEVIVIDLSSGNYYSLKGSGADVWQLIEGTASGSQIVSTLESHYGTNGEIEAAVSSFLAQLEQEGLTAPAEAGEGAPNGDASGWKPTKDGGFEAPVLEKFTDMQDLVLLDPVHEVDATGWPQPRPDDAPVTIQDA